MEQNWEQDIREARETYWENPGRRSFADVRDRQRLRAEDIEEASARLRRFAPLIMRLFPETVKTEGLIESPLVDIEETKSVLQGTIPPGRLLLKCDSHLAIAGSVKARGGIYEVLKHTEDLALQAGIITRQSNYAKLAEYPDFFSRYKIQVGSTGNLGMSIGIMSAALGYQAIVHMSKDAREWKKALLRSRGVLVKEYQDDYCKAVQSGRALSEQDPTSYFVDDEQSVDLFLGYAVAGERLQKQLLSMQIAVNERHPLFVYLPCGVGGAPGGITFGLKNIWGDQVHCFFVEPTQAPCMLAAMASGQGNAVSVMDYGLTGMTAADGLAVQRASGLVAEMMEPLVSGLFTVEDARLYDYMKALYTGNGIIIEPSACAAFAGYEDLCRMREAREYLVRYTEKGQEPVHILWATGGSLMPASISEKYLNNGKILPIQQ